MSRTLTITVDDGEADYLIDGMNGCLQTLASRIGEISTPYADANSDWELRVSTFEKVNTAMADFTAPAP